MQRRDPLVFILAEKTYDPEGVAAYLNHVGVPDWKTDAPTHVEGLAELIGRACYRSYAPGLNANVTQVRSRNAAYVRNLIERKHGSVFEHGWVTFAFSDVSRVFTHELVRHRVGCAISQESLRFVRDDELRFWLPPALTDKPEAVGAFEKAVGKIENAYRGLVALFTK